MNRTLIIILNWLFLTLLITTVIYARQLPFNTYQENDNITGNLFLPADYAFSIMNFICLVLIGFAIRATMLLKDPAKASGGLGKLALQISPFFWIVSLLHTGWLLAWHHNQALISFILITALFGCLLCIFFYIQYSPAPLTYFEHVNLETPFVVYFSWITFLYISGIASAIYMTGWNGDRFPL